MSKEDATKKAPKKPKDEELKELLKKHRADLQAMTLSFRAATEKLKKESDDEARLMVAARANAVKPHDAKKKEVVEKAKKAFEAVREQANLDCTKLIYEATAKRDLAIGEAKKAFEKECSHARGIFNDEANILHDEHKKEQQEISDNLEKKLKALDDTYENEKAALNALITQAEEELEKLSKKKPKKAKAQPAEATAD